MFHDELIAIMLWKEWFARKALQFEVRRGFELAAIKQLDGLRAGSAPYA